MSIVRSLYRHVGLIVLLAAVACVPPRFAMMPTPTVVKNYTVGQPQSATVGDAIVRVQQAQVLPMYVAQYEYRIRGLTIARGAPYVATDSMQDGRLYLNDCVPLHNENLVVTPDGAHLFVSGGRQLYALPMPEGPLFRRVEQIGDQPGAFTAELIYSGMADGVVRAIYREYIDNTARPAFTQSLQYDLRADSVIAYKSLRLRILAASNTSLRYAVITDAGLPWLPAARPRQVCGTFGGL